MAFKKLMDQGNEVFTLSYMLVSLPEGATQLRAVGNDPSLTTSLHTEPLPMDEGELIAKAVPPEYHNFFDVFSREEAKLMPPHWPYDHTIDLKNDQAPSHTHIYPLSGTELSTIITSCHHHKLLSLWMPMLTSKCACQLGNTPAVIDPVFLMSFAASWTMSHMCCPSNVMQV